MRCELVRCRTQLVEEVDRLGRIRWRCPGCARRKAGICQTCSRAVEGKVGVAYYCGPCNVLKRRAYTMKWQRNNLKKVAELARKRRWRQKHGRLPPRDKMTLQQAGKIGGKLGAQARLAALTPERVKEIAHKARMARWAKHKPMQGHATSHTTTESLCPTVSSSVAEKSPSRPALPPSGKG